MSTPGYPPKPGQPPTPQPEPCSPKPAEEPLQEGPNQGDEEDGE